MRVGIIRGDLPGPLFLADLEPTSQTNFPTEPAGQTRYVSRPNVALVTAAMTAAAGAGLESTGDITFPLTINAGNQTLKAKISAAAGFTTILIPAAVYANTAALVAAANPVLALSGMALEIDPLHPLRVVLYSLTFGPGSYIQNDTIVGGSTFNTPAVLPNGASFTEPTAAALITALLPVGGPLDVSAATIRTNLGPALTDAQVKTIADSIAPQFVETTPDVVSYQIGDIHGYLLPNYTPDPNRLPALALGPAITVVQDDGVSLFTAALPQITGAVHNTPNPGDLTITGVGMANVEAFNATTVHVTNPTTGQFVRVQQKVIQATLSGGTQGVVTATSIVIPASLLGGATGFGSVVGNTVELQYRTLANTNYGTAANITAVADGISTLTGLTNMNAAMVGNKITLSNCATPGNNGTFFITAFISAASVQIANANLYPLAPDANNGSIRWSVPPPVAFVTT